jgi:ElaB/YqjD/DUF883 family membrane-anchored ribosome-binding protein
MQATPDKLVRDVRVLVQDAEDLIEATAGDIGEKTREARAKLAGALVVAKDSLGKAEDAAAEGVRLANAILQGYPWQCLAAAFVTGVVLGMVAARR